MTASDIPASANYVVVGAGSAGAVIAARLSEDPYTSVVLIEAGSADTADQIHIPAAFPTLFKTRWDWDFDSEPEPHLFNRRSFLPRAAPRSRSYIPRWGGPISW